MNSGDSAEEVELGVEESRRERDTGMPVVIEKPTEESGVVLENTEKVGSSVDVDIQVEDEEYNVELGPVAMNATVYSEESVVLKNFEMFV